MKLVRVQSVRKNVFKPFDISGHKSLFRQKVQEFISLLKGKVANENTRYTPGVHLVIIVGWIVCKG